MIYRLLTSFLLLFFAFFSNAQNAASSPKTRGFLELVFENIILIMGIVVVIAAFTAIIFLFNMLLQLQEIRMLKEQGIEVVEDVESTKESWLSSFYKKITGTIPMEKEEDILFDHEYDGIRELDNNLPPWWTALFYITIIFAVVYLGIYMFSDIGLSPQQEYAQEMEYAEQTKLAFLAKQANQIDENSVVVLEDEASITAGKDIFDKNCVACHGPLGEGNTIGPNMTDEYWINGGGIKNLFKTIKYGVPEKGMQSWKEMLPPVAMQQVASYILTLQGTNPPNAKEAQGEIWTEAEE